MEGGEEDVYRYIDQVETLASCSMADVVRSCQRRTFLSHGSAGLDARNRANDRREKERKDEHFLRPRK